jgi:hypothetical protein
MNLMLLSLHDDNYKTLGEITWNNNKVPYALKHGYQYYCKRNNFNYTLGYEKIFMIRQLFEINNPKIDWIWWTGCDAIITNFNIKIEDIIDDTYHLIIATNCNGINVDSFLIKNSPQGKAYLEHIMDGMPKYINHYWHENKAMMDAYDFSPQYKAITKIVPQRILNAHDYGLYPDNEPIDKLGTNGQWQKGDLLIHWPGVSLEKRIELARHYEQYVIR